MFEECLLRPGDLDLTEMTACFDEIWMARAACHGSIVDVPITPMIQAEASNFAFQVVEVKLREAHHEFDSGSEHKRWFTGFVADRAVRLAWGLHDVPSHLTEIGSNSSLFEFPDLRDLGVKAGVKSSSWGFFPLVKPNESTPQVIVLISEKCDTAHVVGVAVPWMFGKFTSRNFVKSSRVKTKSAFYGIDAVEQFPSSLAEARARFPL